MTIKNDYVLVITIVYKGLGDIVIEAAKEAGAQGATMIPGRGAGTVNVPKLFGIPVEPDKEIILTAVPESIGQTVLETITERVDLNAPSTGICMIMPLQAIAGLTRFLEEETKDA